MTAGKVDDAQAAIAQAKLSVEVEPFVVGAAMDHGVRCQL
jgi:hypothetical protein